jgi:trehalose synthase
MQGFVEHLDTLANAQLMLVGPNVHGVADDPEGGEVLAECLAAWHKLPLAQRSRVHIVCLPMEDIEENAAMVNAIQRHAAVIVQKSLHEGFGLTVTEAMWKGRPIVASAVGGIQDQISSGKHGLLITDPTDLRAFAQALQCLLSDRALARNLGRNARRRAITHFLGSRQLVRHADLLTTIEGHVPGPIWEKVSFSNNGYNRPFPFTHPAALKA